MEDDPLASLEDIRDNLAQLAPQEEGWLNGGGPLRVVVVVVVVSLSCLSG